MRMLGIGLLVLMGAFVLLMVVGSSIPSKPYTYAQLASDEAARCIRNKGDGQWRGSMGISLDTFCQAVGRLEMLRAQRKDHPELF